MEISLYDWNRKKKRKKDNLLTYYRKFARINLWFFVSFFFLLLSILFCFQSITLIGYFHSNWFRNLWDLCASISKSQQVQDQNWHWINPGCVYRPSFLSDEINWSQSDLRVASAARTPPAAYVGPVISISQTFYGNNQMIYVRKGVSCVLTHRFIWER